MKLNTNDLYLLSQCAISAAYQAGQLISEYTNKRVEVKMKTVGESLASQVVTEVDKMSEAIILETLKPTCEIYDLALLSEETTDDKSRLEKDFFWCIDPIDGTLQFTESIPGYATSIALVSKSGIPFIGVAYDPVEKVLYSAIKGQGAFRNRTPWKLEKSAKVMSLVTEPSFFQNSRFAETKEKLAIIAKNLGYKNFNAIEYGGSVMNALNVLERGSACYFKFPKTEEGGGSLWDFAATACIFNEMEASVSDMFGNPLELNRRESCFMNHKGALFASDDDIVKQIIDMNKVI